METFELGKTGIAVSRLGLGCWQASGWASSNEEMFIETINHAVESGVTLLDTAEGYGNGISETLIGKALQGKRGRVIVSTVAR